jgi:hypothetical protein
MGWSRPSRARTIVRVSSLACRPAMSRATSRGTAKYTMNTSDATSQTTSAPHAMRRSRKPIIRRPLG